MADDEFAALMASFRDLLTATGADLDRATPEARQALRDHLETVLRLNSEPQFVSSRMRRPDTD